MQVRICNQIQLNTKLQTVKILSCIKYQITEKLWLSPFKASKKPWTTTYLPVLGLSQEVEAPAFGPSIPEPTVFNPSLNKF